MSCAPAQANSKQTLLAGRLNVQKGREEYVVEHLAVVKGNCRQVSVLTMSVMIDHQGLTRSENSTAVDRWPWEEVVGKDAAAVWSWNYIQPRSGSPSGFPLDGFGHLVVAGINHKLVQKIFGDHRRQLIAEVARRVGGNYHGEIKHSRRGR